MSPLSQTDLQRLLVSANPTDRAALLHWVREAPLVYGYWGAWKALYKQVERLPDPELFGAMAGRLDAAPFSLTGPAALKANPAKLEGCNSVAFVGRYAYGVSPQWRNQQNVRVFDLVDPFSPKQIASLQVSDAMRLVLHGTRALVFTGQRWRQGRYESKVFTLDLSDPANPRILGEAIFLYANGAAVSGSRAYLLKSDSYQDPGGLQVLRLEDPANPAQEGFLEIDNPTTLVISGAQAVVLSQGIYRTPCRLHLVDLSDAASPRLGKSIEMSNATGVALSGNYAYVTVGEQNAYQGGSDNPGVRGLRVLNLSGGGLLSAIGLQAGLLDEVAALELGNARGVQIQGNYAYVAVGKPGRPVGLRIVDIADPRHPKVVGSLDGLDCYGVQVDGGLALVSTYFGQVQRFVDVSEPTKPLLIGTPPKRMTFGYMKRRVRRALKNLSESSPEAYVEAAYQTLRQAGAGRDSLDLATQWACADILYGGTNRYLQSGHGRGAYHPARKGLSLRTRDERHPEAWDARPDLAASLLTQSDLPWQVSEAALKMLRGSHASVPDFPAAVLSRFLRSSSPLLVSTATRQAVTLLQGRKLPDANLIAETFFLSGAGRRRRIEQMLDAQKKPDWWEPKFAERLFQLATGGEAAELSRRQKTAVVFAITRSPQAISPALLLAVFPRLLALGRPELTQWVLDALRRVAPAAVPDWLAAFPQMPDALRETALAALREGLAGQPFDFPTARALVQSEAAWVREQGWVLLAQSSTEVETLARVWNELLDSAAETPALQTAFASPSALLILDRAQLNGDELVARLETRPFLVRLLSGQAFSTVALAVPAGVTVRMIAAMPDEQWQAVRGEFLQALGGANKLAAFWRAAWIVIGDNDDQTLRARLLDDPAVAGSFLAVDDPSFLEDTTNPVFDDLLGRWASVHDALFARDSGLLLAAATHQLPSVRAWGLARVRGLGMGLPFALRLLEAELPESVTVGQTFFEAAPAGSSEETENALALCDSPKASVRALGRVYVQSRWDALPHSEIVQRLSENPDPQTQAFLAARLGESAPETAAAVQQFDRQVLRARDRGRAAKELVKQRRSRPSQTPDDHLDTATLLEIARSRTPRDAEWALAQLARLALDGQAIEGLSIEGVAGV